MTAEFPLLDGRTLDLDHELDGHPATEPGANKTVVLHEDFAREELPWWLSSSTEGGTVHFDGLASGDATDVILSTDSGAAGNRAVLEGPTVNWSNWTAIRFYAWGVSQSDLGARSYCHLADSADDTAIDEGFHAMVVDRDSGDNGWFGRVLSAGDSEGRLDPGDTDSSIDNEADDRRIDVRQPHDYGFRIHDNEQGSGYDIDWVTDGSFHSSWPAELGFPAPTDLTFRVGIRSTEPASEHTLRVDGIRIELVP